MTRAEAKAKIADVLVAYMVSEPCATCTDHPSRLRVEASGPTAGIFPPDPPSAIEVMRFELRSCDGGQFTKSGRSWATDEVLDRLCDALGIA